MNRKEYKRAMSGVRPSEQTIERIFDMTVDKKTKTNTAFKRIAATVLALAVFVGGGYGASQFVKNSNSEDIVSPTKPAIVEAINPLSVMVAYAKDDSVAQKSVKLGTKTPIDYSFEIYDIRDMDDSSINAIKERLKKENQKLKYDDSGAFKISTGTEYLDNVIIRKAVFNAFVLDIDNTQEVERIELSANTNYWILNYMDTRAGVELKDLFPRGQHLSITGKDYIELLNANKDAGYDNLYINLEHDMNLCNEIDKNPDIDLSTFDDTLTFTVEYKNGRIEQSNIDISLNQDGRLSITIK